jgi:hypothetical protein
MKIRENMGQETLASQNVCLEFDKEFAGEQKNRVS